MSRLLKGNYEVPQEKNPVKSTDGDEDQNSARTQHEFERRAMERLGGSIAFVMKAKTFLWNGEEKNEAKG